MNFNNYTITAHEALQKATEIATSRDHQVIETGHLLSAILISDENLISFILKKLGITKSLISGSLEDAINGYPKVSGGQPYLSNDAAKALQSAEKYLREFQDEFVAVEHVLLGLLAGTDKTAQILKDAGFQKKQLIAAIKELRGGEKVVDQDAESKYRSF